MKTKNRPLYLKLLVPMLVLILVEILLLAGFVFGGGLIRYMENNEIEILHERVLNRQRYLQNEMLTRWSKVENTVARINTETEKLLQQGSVSLDTLDDGSQYSLPLLKAAAEPLIEMMRNNKVTGVFLVLNTDDLEEMDREGIYRNKPGIYIRDSDPESHYSDKNTDLLMEYAPSELVKKLNIGLDGGWKTQFNFENAGEYASYLYEPYEAALHIKNRTRLQVSDMGYWSEPYYLNEGDKGAVSYSVPLILEDGTVYGVLGVDLSLEYLENMLPSEELKDESAGSYLLGIEKNSDTEITNVLISGADYSQINGSQKVTEIYNSRDKQMIRNDAGEEIYCDVESLSLYNTNTPFEDQKWVLTGIIRGKNLFIFSNSVKKALLRGALATLLAGVLGGILISLYISRPVAALTESVRKMKPFSRSSFSRTGIREIDIMAGELEHLNRETLYAAERFSYIIHAANLPLAVFEVNGEDHTVFITGRFFEMLHLPRRDFSTLTEEEFWEMLDTLKGYRNDTPARKENETLYKIPLSDDETEKVRYIRITLNRNGSRCIGLVEDITDTAIEKETIEYERDHDLLTGLWNRRAFNRIMTELFEQGTKTLKTAALVMVDLDELKRVNDTYGHEYGDRYIQTAAKCFVKNTPEQTIVCRRSGDEFNIFFYGYENREEIRKLLKKLQEGIGTVSIPLPDGTILALRMSAGVAWYPDDTAVYQKLKSYADYAMYQIKHGSKNQFGEFDKDAYMRENYK